MNRRFNFTERKRILQEHINIRLNEGKAGEIATFDAEFELSDLELAPDAPVMVEAYRGPITNRYPWGTVGQPAPPEDRRLTDMQDNPLFRVKVVAADQTGILLAMANRIHPHREERHSSLVRLNMSNDLGKEVWRLDFGDGNPTLYLNSSIVGISMVARNNREFQSLVFPEVLRTMLTHAIAQDAEPDADDGDWVPLMTFVRSFHDEALPPRVVGEEVDERSTENMRWINNAVRAFTQKNFPASDFFAETLQGR